MASNITTLVEKAKKGDADAFSTLYQMYYPKMKGICINILREDKAVVDDLVQDAFILAFVSLKDLKNTHRFSQWLTSITTNLVLKYQEKGKRYDFVSLSDVEEEFSTVLEDDNTSKQSISYEDKYDVILLHDVIEHVPTKEPFLAHLRKFMKTKGVLFVGFPAWQMPFGGHHQICRSKLCSHLPFIHMLPNPLYRLLLKTCNEEKGTMNELMSIKECRTSIELFERLIHQCGFSVTDQKLWFINPHYKQKFHLTPRLLPHWVWKVKYIRNFFTTSCWYILNISIVD